MTPENKEPNRKGQVIYVPISSIPQSFLTDSLPTQLTEYPTARGKRFSPEPFVIYRTSDKGTATEPQILIKQDNEFYPPRAGSAIAMICEHLKQHNLTSKELKERLKEYDLVLQLIEQHYQAYSLETKLELFRAYLLTTNSPFINITNVPHTALQKLRTTLTALDPSLGLEPAPDEGQYKVPDTDVLKRSPSLNIHIIQEDKVVFIRNANTDEELFKVPSDLLPTAYLFLQLQNKANTDTRAILYPAEDGEEPKELDFNSLP